MVVQKKSLNNHAATSYKSNVLVLCYSLPCKTSILIMVKRRSNAQAPLPLKSTIVEIIAVLLQRPRIALL